jgi:hypothetical protein
VLLLVSCSCLSRALACLVLEKSGYLSVTLMQRNGARRFGPCFDAQSQPIEHEHDDEHEHDF